ncbi:hypothetical protein JZU56_06365, partial [bacterium]|nr:hypothetical protein [bacterium]
MVNAVLGSEDLVAGTISGDIAQMAGGGSISAEAELPLLFAQASGAAVSTVAAEGAGGGAVSTSAAASVGGMSIGTIAT